MTLLCTRGQRLTPPSRHRWRRFTSSGLDTDRQVKGDIAAGQNWPLLRKPERVDLQKKLTALSP
jgi:hypothetical protein